MHYNFCRIRQSLRVTPAMEAASPIMFGAIAKLVAVLDEQDESFVWTR
jgi:hypothetical protein